VENSSINVSKITHHFYFFLLTYSEDLLDTQLYIKISLDCFIGIDDTMIEVTTCSGVPFQNGKVAFWTLI